MNKEFSKNKMIGNPDKCLIEDSKIKIKNFEYQK